MDVQYLGLGDLLVIASAVLGIEAEVLAKATNLITGDSALNAPAAAFGGIEFYPDFATKVVCSATASLATTPCPTATSARRSWRWSSSSSATDVTGSHSMKTTSSRRWSTSPLER